MDTIRKYYEDSHLRRFSAQVVCCEKASEGFWIELDQTAFFPGGGGQACDCGTIGGAAVADMKEDGQRVLHLCTREFSVGETVTGEVNWEHRFDLMQQHSGEHILSGLIHAKFGLHNVGFHMGADAVTIDFDGEVPDEALPELERKANEAVWENIPLKIWTPSSQELPNVSYRTKRALPWPVRIVEIPGYDSCACCGVHVKATGEIGPIKILSTVGFRGGVRMEILCGKRALEYLSRSHQQNQMVSREFSVPVGETGAAARKMNEQAAKLKFQIGAMQRKLFAAAADRCENAGNVLMFQEDLAPASVRTLAELVSLRCGAAAAVFSGTDETGYSYCLAQQGGDLRTFVKKMNELLHGRGGGKPEFQQGSLRDTKQSIMAYFTDFKCIE